MNPSKTTEKKNSTVKPSSIPKKSESKISEERSKLVPASKGRKTSEAGIEKPKQIKESNEDNKADISSGMSFAETNELKKKTKVLELDIKKLKARVETIEKEKAELEKTLEEKIDIINVLTSNKPFNEKRQMLMYFTVAKQRKYIRELIRVIKNSNAILTEMENQMDSCFKFFDEAKDDPKKEEKAIYFKQLAKRLIEIRASCSLDRAKDIDKEYRNEEKVSNNQIFRKENYLLAIEKNLNTIVEKLLGSKLQREEKKRTKESKKEEDSNIFKDKLNEIDDIKLLQNTIELIWGSGLRVENIHQSLLLDESSNSKLAAVNAKLQHMEFIDEKTPLKADPSVETEKTKENHNINNIILKEVDSLEAESINIYIKNEEGQFYFDLLFDNLITSLQDGSFDKKKVDHIFQKLAQAKKMLTVSFNMFSKQNNLLRAFVYETQAMVEKLSKFSVDNISKVISNLEESVLFPFKDLYEIYQKFYIEEKSPAYAVNLSSVFSIKCEKIKSGLETLLKVREDEMINKFTEKPILSLAIYVKSYKEYREMLMKKIIC